MKVRYYSHRGGYNGTTRVQGYRKSNEDTILVMQLSSDSASYHIALVCDGMGGGVDGKYASSKVCSQVKQQFENFSLPEQDCLAVIQNNVYRAISDAHEHIKSKYQGNGVSATTCTAVVTDGARFRYLHIGDSRLYSLDSGQLHLLTVDDTWVNREVSAGRMTEQEALKHPKRHVITKAIGTGTIASMVLSNELALADGLLLTSDGFSEYLSIERVSRMLNQEASLEDLALEMIEQGQRDNISAVWLSKE